MVSVSGITNHHDSKKKALGQQEKYFVQKMYATAFSHKEYSGHHSGTGNKIKTYLKEQATRARNNGQK